MTAHRAACAVAGVLAGQGYTAYLAGGCVRDRLLGSDPKDFDIATDAPPARVRELFPGAHLVGEVFGVVVVRHDGHAIEVATFRTEGRYSDGRHPDSVEFSDAQHDAMRRDFTINGIFEDPATGAVIDFVDGRSDLKCGIVRAIGDPQERIHEDELRMLRAVRFAARLEFEIDPHTAAAIRTHGAALRGVSPERVGQEIRWMLEHRTRARAVALLTSLDLDGVVLEGMPPDRRQSCARDGSDRASSEPPGQRDRTPRLAALRETAPVTVALAAWARDRHGPGPLDGVVRRWRKRLVLSNAERDGLLRTLECEHALRTRWADLGVAARKRLAATPEFPAGLTLLEAAGGPEAARRGTEVEELRRTGLAPVPLVDGMDLQRIGLAPGPAFGTILDRVYDAQLEGSVADRAAALALARTLAATR